jgi:hypothetical protein
MHGIPRFLVEDQARLIGLPLEAVFLGEKAGNDSYDRAMTAVLEKIPPARLLRDRLR